MGLFDGKSNIPTTVLGMAQGFGDNLGRAALDPIMENFGYESEESRILEVVKGADISNPESFTKTFNALLDISGEAANEFKTQGMPLLEAHLAQQKIDATAASKRPDERKQQLIDAQKNEVKAGHLSTLFGVAGTIEAKEKLLTGLNNQGLANTSLYKETQNQINTLKSAKLRNKSQQELEAHREAQKVHKELQVTYKSVLSKGQGKDLVRTFFLANSPEGETTGDNLFDALVGQVGATVEAYDKSLQADYATKGITPSGAKSYYNKVLALPQVYTGGGPLWGMGDARFDSVAFDGALNKTFGRKGEVVYEAELKDYLTNGLIIPGRTIVELGGMRAMVSPQKLEQLRQQYGVQ